VVPELYIQKAMSLALVGRVAVQVWNRTAAPRRRTPLQGGRWQLVLQGPVFSRIHHHVSQPQQLVRHRPRARRHRPVPHQDLGAAVVGSHAYSAGPA